MSGEDEEVKQPEVPVAPVWTATDQDRLLKNTIESAPSVEEVLGKPDTYREWLKKAQEALNG